MYQIILYINSRRNVDSKISKSQMGDLVGATGDPVVNKGQIVGIDWKRIARLHSHVLAHMNSLTALRCHIKASHMNSLTASHRHIEAYQDASNQPPK